MHARTIARFLLTFALVSSTAAAPGAPAPTADAALAPFRAFVDGVNKGDTKAAAAAFATDSVIIDEFKPFLWRGKAFHGWFSSLGAWAKEHKVANMHIGVASPTEFVAGKGAAYAVVPSHLTFTKNGKPASEDGTFSVALKLYKRGWRIAAWAWATKQNAS